MYSFIRSFNAFSPASLSIWFLIDHFTWTHSCTIIHHHLQSCLPFVHFSSLPTSNEHCRRCVNLNQFCVDTWSVQAHRLDASVLLIIIASCENLRELWNFSTHLNSTSLLLCCSHSSPFLDTPITDSDDAATYVNRNYFVDQQHDQRSLEEKNYTEVPQPVFHSQNNIENVWNNWQVLTSQRLKIITRRNDGKVRKWEETKNTTSRVVIRIEIPIELWEQEV